MENRRRECREATRKGGQPPRFTWLPSRHSRTRRTTPRRPRPAGLKVLARACRRESRRCEARMSDAAELGSNGRNPPVSQTRNVGGCRGGLRRFAANPPYEKPALCLEKAHRLAAGGAQDLAIPHHAAAAHEGA